MDVADAYVTFVRHSQDVLRDKVNEEMYIERLFDVSKCLLLLAAQGGDPPKCDRIGGRRISHILKKTNKQKMDWSWFKENLFCSLCLRLLTVVSVLNPLLVLAVSESQSVWCVDSTQPLGKQALSVRSWWGRVLELAKTFFCPILLLATRPRVRITVPIGEAEASTPCPRDSTSMMPAVACRCAINVTLLCLPTCRNSCKTGHPPLWMLPKAESPGQFLLWSMVLSVHLPTSAGVGKSNESQIHWAAT